MINICEEYTKQLNIVYIGKKNKFIVFVTICEQIQINIVVSGVSIENPQNQGNYAIKISLFKNYIFIKKKKSLLI